MTGVPDSTDRLNFIEQVIVQDNEEGTYGGQVHTRFPPEPNGYLHIGHAKSICLNFGLANKYNGLCNLRFDDTNPTKEERRIRRLHQRRRPLAGIRLGKIVYYASDYFEQLYDWAVQLIKAGKAYVCDLTAEQIREYRGTLTQPGRDSPYRDRTVTENLDLFERMRPANSPTAHDVAGQNRYGLAQSEPARPGDVPHPACAHHRTGDKWCIYPMYDFTHGQSDSIESITHSICTLEFEDHRPLYNWYLDQLEIYHPTRSNSPG